MSEGSGIGQPAPGSKPDGPSTRAMIAETLGRAADDLHAYLAASPDLDADVGAEIDALLVDMDAIRIALESPALYKIILANRRYSRTLPTAPQPTPIRSK